MHAAVAALLLFAQPTDLGPGDHAGTLACGGERREYLVHVPKCYDSTKPTPLILALHGAGMNGSMMVGFSGLNATSEQAGFIVVYPSGTGLGPFRVWNADSEPNRRKADDVAFLHAVLDDVAKRIHVDPTRVYACGMSNGGMMCYRLASEMSDRIAAIAPVAGTIAMPPAVPKRPVSVMHFHGLSDHFVPYEGLNGRRPPFIRLLSVEESVCTWVKFNGCEPTPDVAILTPPGDSMKVVRKSWKGGTDQSEVLLITIEGGGHTWPGQRPPVPLIIGRSTRNISANDLMWEFFSRHKLK
jgi:polyhydroxybutyrate depolymerase